MAGIAAIKVTLRPVDDKPETLTAFRGTISRWKMLCEREKEFVNRMWMEWLVYHHAAGTGDKIRAALAELTAWHNLPTKDRPDKPTFKLEAYPKELRKRIDAICLSDFGDMHSRLLALTKQKVSKLIQSRKSTNGNLPGWWSILLNREGVPSSTRPLPFPIDIQNVTLKEHERGFVTLGIRANRTTPRAGSSVGSSVPDYVVAVPNTRDYRGRDILKQLARGERKFKGSTIIIEEGRAIMMMTYETADEPPIVGTNKALLWPSRQQAMNLMIVSTDPKRDEPVRRLGGSCEDVQQTRRRIQSQRWSRQENYRHAGSSTKGHGRDRALEGYKKLTQQWTGFQNHFNNWLVQAVLRSCKRHGICEIKFAQPTNDEARRVDVALVRGNPLPKNAMTGWDWFSFQSKLSNVLMRNGVAVQVLKPSGE